MGAGLREVPWRVSAGGRSQAARSLKREEKVILGWVKKATKTNACTCCANEPLAKRLGSAREDLGSARPISALERERLH